MLLDKSCSRPSLVDEGIVYNVALGSNMDPAKLVSRKGADGKGVSLLGGGVPCTVRDWSLSFEFLALPPAEPVMAAGVPRKGAVLHGVLYKLSNECYQTLAETEGCPRPRSLYVECEVEAVVYPNVTTPLPKTPIRAVLFAMRDPPKTFPPHLYPSQRYMTFLIAGARMAKLERAVVESLEKAPVARSLSPRMRGYSRFHMIGLFFLYRSEKIKMLLRIFHKPYFARLFSRREAGLIRNEKFSAFFWTCILVLLMSPFAFLGFLRALYQRRDVLLIARGETEAPKRK